MDTCVVTYRNTSYRIRPALRPQDTLWVRDNTTDNIGFPAAANELAACGKDPIILFINPDLDPAPGCFDALEGAFEDASIVAVGAADHPGESPPTVDPQWLSGACLAVRRQAFEQVKGFDASLFLYGEDVDLSYRLARLGRLTYEAGAVYSHDAGERGFRAQFLQARNYIVVQRRHGRPSGLLATVRAGAGSLGRGHLRLGIARLVGAAASLHRS